MKDQLDGKTYLQKLQTFAYLSLGIPLLFFIYIYLESSIDQLVEIIPSRYHVSLLVPFVVLVLLLLYWNQKKYKSSMLLTLQKPELREKLRLYQQASNMRFFIYGICSLKISIGFYLTDFEPFAALFGIMLVLFSIHNPNTRRIVRDLKLKDKYREIILNGLEIP